MAITKSAKKAAKQSAKRTIVNNMYKISMKFAIKEFKDTLKKWTEWLSDKLVVAQKRIDKAAKVNVITVKSAARRKSNLTLSFNKTLIK